MQIRLKNIYNVSLKLTDLSYQKLNYLNSYGNCTIQFQDSQIIQLQIIQYKISDMISEPSIILTLTFLILTYIAYRIIKAYRFKSFFAKQAQSAGFNVYEHPYCWLGSQMYNEFKRQYQIHGDTNYHYKHQLSKPDLIVSNILFRTMVQLQNPQLVKEFYLKANEGYYEKTDYGLGHLRRLIGTQNLLLSEGQYWKNRRKLLSGVFNYDFITNQIGQIQKITRKALQNLQKTNTKSDNPSEVSCDIVQPLLYVFSTVIMKCFFEEDALEYIGEQKTIDFIGKVLVKLATSGRSKAGVLLGVKFAKLGLTKNNRQINQKIVKFRSVAKKIIQKRIKQIRQSQNNKNNIRDSNTENQKQIKADDMIQALIKNKQIVVSNEKSKTGQTIDIDSIINQFLTFFIAGSQTTLAFTRMMIYRLAWHPQILQKVRQQFQKQTNTDEITLNQLKNLKYFEKVQKQVLRMDSSVGAIFMRVATKDHYLGNLKIYKGTVVNVRLRAIHFKQKQFPSANQFNPQRWNDDTLSNTYSYIPFSAGARNCIGKHLALMQNKIFMIEFLRKYKDIKVSKKQSETKFQISGLYGPQKLTTTLTKFK